MRLVLGYRYRLPVQFPVKIAVRKAILRSHMKKPLIKNAQQVARTLDVGGFKITVLASTEETGGYELFRIAGPQGTDPGPHHHDWDESFFVLNGAVHCGVDEAETLATTGALIHVPGGCTHWFRFAEGGGEFFSITSRGNAAKMFEAFDKGINWADPDRRALLALAASYGQTVVTSSSTAGKPG